MTASLAACTSADLTKARRAAPRRGCGPSCCSPAPMRGLPSALASLNLPGHHVGWSSLEGLHPGRRLRPFVLSWSGRTGGRSDLGPDAGRLHRSGQRLDVVGAIVPLPVDEEGRRAGYAAEVCRLDVLGDPAREDVPLELVMKRIAVQLQFIGVLQQIGDP